MKREKTIRETNESGPVQPAQMGRFGRFVIAALIVIIIAASWLATRASAEVPFVPFPSPLGTVSTSGGGGGGGGTITGGGTPGQVAFWDGLTNITGDPGFTYDAPTDTLTFPADGNIVFDGVVLSTILFSNATVDEALLSYNRLTTTLELSTVYALSLFGDVRFELLGENTSHVSTDGATAMDIGYGPDQIEMTSVALYLAPGGVGGGGNQADFSALSTVFNSTSIAVDFQVKTVTDVNGIFIDAAAETMLLMGGPGSTGCSIDAAGNFSCAGTVAGSGTITGSGVAGQMTYWTGASTQAGNAGFTYDPTFAYAALSDAGLLDVTWYVNSAGGVALSQTATADTTKYASLTTSSGVGGGVVNIEAFGAAYPVSAQCFGNACAGSVSINTDGAVVPMYVGSTSAGDFFIGTNNIVRATFDDTTGVVFNDIGANYDFRIEGDTDANLLFVDASTDRVGIGTLTPGAKLDLVAGTLAVSGRAMKNTATFTASAATQIANEWTVTSAVGATGVSDAFSITLAAGTTAAANTYALDIANVAAGTGTWDPLTSQTLTANQGVISQTFGSTVGSNFSVLGISASGALNYGIIGMSGGPQFGANNGFRQDSFNVGTGGSVIDTKNAASTTEKHVGVIGVALNGDVNVGGYFGLRTGTPTLTSAALIADNGATTSNIFEARDNGTPVCTIADGGNLSCTGTISGSGTITGSGVAGQVTFWSGASTIAGDVGFTVNAATGIVMNESGLATYDVRVEGDTEANMVFVDASTNRVGFGTATPAYRVESEFNVDGSNFIGVKNTTNGASAVAGMYMYNGSNGVSFEYRPPANTFTEATAGTGYVANVGYIRSDTSTGTGVVISAGQNCPGGVCTATEIVRIGNDAGSIFLETARSTMFTLAGVPGSYSGSGAFVINELSQNVDFRAETDTNINGIFLDASAETIDLVGGSGSTGCSISAAGALTCTGAISGSGSLSGSGAATQVTFFTAASTVAGDAGMTYVSGTDSLTILGSMTAGDLTLNGGDTYLYKWLSFTPQVATCAAGVIGLTPTTAVISVDPAGAACVVTLAQGTAPIGSDVTFTIVASAGAGVVTFPDVANIHDGPTLCTTTGLVQNGVYTITLADEADDLWLGKACTQN